MDKFEELDAAYKDSFMKPEITKRTEWAEIEGRDGGTDFVPLIDLAGELEDLDYVVIFSGIGARLSANGWDCTDWVVFNTVEEAIDYLLEEAI